MRIAVVCNDTRGGVQPYVALAIGLRAAGHEVRAVAPQDLAPMFTSVGIPVAELAGSIEEVLRSSNGAAEDGSLAAMRLGLREMASRIGGWTRVTLDACEGADVVTGGVGGMVVALSVADKLGVPFVPAHLQPIDAPSSDYPGVLLAGTPRWLGGWGRWLSHHLSDAALWMPFRRAMATARANVLGLHGPARAAHGQPVLYGFSRHVVSVPTHPTQPRHTTGYWSLSSEGWRPPAGLEAFLASGPPPVSIGFGSMISRDPNALTELVIRAVRGAGVRAILLSGWGGLAALSEPDAFCAPALPHEWLFPRVAAVVHHGGAGTTGAAVRAGVPSIVVPFAVDQPFWGSRIAALGVGPRPIPRRRLTEARLTEALVRATTDAAMIQRATELGTRVREEDGVAAAVGHFDEFRSALRAA